MKLFKSFISAHSALLKDIAVSVSLVGATAGIVFGISAGNFAIHYMDLQSSAKRWSAHNNKTTSYISENIDSKWNMEGSDKIESISAPNFKAWTSNPEEKMIDDDKKEKFAELHPNFSMSELEQNVLWKNYSGMGMSKTEGESLDNSEKTERYAYNSMVIDGAAHTTLDRSFNQTLYSGLVDFNQNKIVDRIDPETETDPLSKNIAHSYKPSQDNPTSFMEIYKSVMANGSQIIALAGFNHSTPLNELMIHEPGGEGGKLKGTVSNPNSELNRQINKTGFILIDSSCPNNQNVASVLFRSDQPGFLSSLATCQYLHNNLQMYHNHYQNIAVGMYGGVAIPTVVDYMGGFQRGVEFFNNFVLGTIIKNGKHEYFIHNGQNPHNRSYLDEFTNLVNFSRYKDELVSLKDDPAGEDVFDNQYKSKFLNEFAIKIIKLGGISTHFTGNFADGEAIGISRQLLNRGASAIICVAGPQSLDTAQEIANQGSKCIVVGVDSAMEDSDYQRYHKGYGPKTRIKPDKNDPYFDNTKGNDGSISSEANAIIKFSAVKDIRSVTKKITRLCATGMNWDVSDKKDLSKPDPTSAVCGPGFQTCGNVLNGLISISWDGFVPLMQAFQLLEFNDPSTNEEITFDKVWESAVAQYKEDIGESAWNKLNETYRLGILNIDNLMTFKKTDEENGKPTPYYECYNHTIAILGRLLASNYAKFRFLPSMSLWHDDEGKIIPMENPDGEDMTIKEWLDTNMYLCI